MPIYAAGFDPDFRADVSRPVFCALGPLEVRAGDGLLHVGGPQIRTLLALLLARPGQVMSLSTLVSSLWSGDAPPAAERTVRTYMSRLRHALAPLAGRAPSGQLVVATPPGYLLRADPLSVDASRFEQLALAGRHALTRNDPLAARSHLREALALWRGDAYAEFADVPLLRTEASRLEELRLNTVENRVQSELKLGLGADLVAEMDSLVSSHPLRERLWVQYMIALYRAGRQAEALSAYQRARAYLADELGLEPSGELADTHRKILSHDPELLPSVNDSVDPEAERVAIVIAGRFGGRREDPLPPDVGPPSSHVPDRLPEAVGLAESHEGVQAGMAEGHSACCAAAHAAAERSPRRPGRQSAPGRAEGWLARVLRRRCVRALVGRLTRRSSPLSRWLTSLAALGSIRPRESGR